jgi:hypothetical protein
MPIRGTTAKGNLYIRFKVTYPPIQQSKLREFEKLLPPPKRQKPLGESIDVTMCKVDKDVRKKRDEKHKKHEKIECIQQ